MHWGKGRDVYCMDRLIVIAAIIYDEGRFLLAQRRPGGKHALKWEFPGGKLEFGENPETGIKREILEELGMEILPTQIYAAQSVVEENRQIILLYYLATHTGGVPETLECNDYCWVHPKEVLSFDLAPADRKVAESLIVNYPKFIG